MRRESSDPYGSGADHAGRQHAGAAFAIRILAVGGGDVQGASGSYESAGWITEPDSDGQRQRDAERVAKTHPQVDLLSVEMSQRAPEGSERLAHSGCGKIGATMGAKASPSRMC